MPTIGDLHTFAGTEDKPEEGYRSRYDKSTEKASAGYYSVFLSDYKIQAEATALPHSGMLRFTFPESRRPAYKSIWPGGWEEHRHFRA